MRLTHAQPQTSHSGLPVAEEAVVGTAAPTVEPPPGGAVGATAACGPGRQQPQKHAALSPSTLGVQGETWKPRWNLFTVSTN